MTAFRRGIPLRVYVRPGEGSMTGAELAELRLALGLTQAEMAPRMGLTQSGLYAVERRGADPIKKAQAMAAHWVSVEIAIERRQPMLATPKARTLVTDLHGLLTGPVAPTPTASSPNKAKPRRTIRFV